MQPVALTSRVGSSEERRPFGKRRFASEVLVTLRVKRRPQKRGFSCGSNTEKSDGRGKKVVDRLPPFPTSPLRSSSLGRTFWGPVGLKAASNLGAKRGEKVFVFFRQAARLQDCRTDVGLCLELSCPSAAHDSVDDSSNIACAFETEVARSLGGVAGFYRDILIASGKVTRSISITKLKTSRLLTADAGSRSSLCRMTENEGFVLMKREAPHSSRRVFSVRNRHDGTMYDWRRGQEDGCEKRTVILNSA